MFCSGYSCLVISRHTTTERSEGTSGKRSEASMSGGRTKDAGELTPEKVVSQNCRTG